MFSLEERRQVTVAQRTTIAHLAEHGTELVPVRCRCFDGRQHTEWARFRPGPVTPTASVHLHVGHGTKRLTDEVLVYLGLRLEAGAAALGNT